MLYSTLLSMDNPHFYRATNIFAEPRIEHNYLTSFDATLGGGSTTKSRNSDHATVPLLDIYGPNVLVINNIPTTFSIDGTFKILESNLSYAQNLAYGLLLFFHLPVRSLNIKNVSFMPTNNQISFTNDALQLLSHNGVLTCQSKETGIGDFTSLVGITHNYQNTQVLDFIDGTVTAGILAPTGKKKNEHELFSLPLGYNGHWGFPFSGALSLGAYEWITVGAYANALLFVKTHRFMNLKTTIDQSGIIKLGFGTVSVDKGTVWNTGLYFKADHFAYGLSLTAAYSCAGEQKSTLNPLKSSMLDYVVINSDPILKGWKMHTIHFVAEYDFAQQNSKMGLRVSAFYNRQIGGTRVFKTNMSGGSFGLDIGWDL